MWFGTALVLTSMLLGVLGVLFDARDKNNKSLNTPGIFMIVGIVVAALLGVAQQRSDAISKSLEAAQSKELAEIQLASMGKALTNIERGLQPLLDKLVVTVRFTIPCTAISKEAAADLCSEPASTPTPLNTAPTKIRKEIEGRFISNLGLLLFVNGSDVDFFNGEKHITMPDLTAVRGSGVTDEEIDTRFDGSTLHIVAKRAVLETRYATGELVSAKDLDDVTVGVNAPRLYFGKVVAVEVVTRTGAVFRSDDATKMSFQNGLWVGKLVPFRVDTGL
jgi:hypothetical protein